MYSLLLLNLIMPFVMILVGYILKRHPATDIKSGNGYSTPTSRKSQEHWNYAQSIAPNNFISLGKILGVVEIIVSIGMFFLQISVNISLMVGICIGIVLILSILVDTFISKISFPMQPGPEIGSISDA